MVRMREGMLGTQGFAMRIESKALLLLFLILLAASVPAYLDGPESWLTVSILTYVLALPGSLLVGLFSVGLAWVVSELGLSSDNFRIAEFLVAWTLCLVVAQYQASLVRRFHRSSHKAD